MGAQCWPRRIVAAVVVSRCSPLRPLGRLRPSRAASSPPPSWQRSAGRCARAPSLRPELAARPSCERTEQPSCQRPSCQRRAQFVAAGRPARLGATSNCRPQPAAATTQASGHPSGGSQIAPDRRVLAAAARARGLRLELGARPFERRRLLCAAPTRSPAAGFKAPAPANQADFGAEPESRGEILCCWRRSNGSNGIRAAAECLWPPRAPLSRLPAGRLQFAGRASNGSAPLFLQAAERSR